MTTLLIALLIAIISLLLIRETKTFYYLFSLLIISSFLVVYPQFISPYLVGIDSHDELEMARITFESGQWDPSIQFNVVNAALSITIFVPIISVISSLSPNNVLKFVLCLYPVLSLIVILLFNKKLFRYSNKSSFLSVLLVAATSDYMMLSAYGRQEIAFYVITLIVYFIFVYKKSSVQIEITIILLIIGLIMSHYSSSLLFISIFVISSFIERLFYKMNKKLKYVLISIVTLTFWLMYIVLVTQLAIINRLCEISIYVSNLMIDKTSNVVQQQLSPSYPNIFGYINYSVNILILFSLIIGVITINYDAYIDKKYVSEKFIKYAILSFTVVLSVFVAMFPGISLAYNIERIYLMMLFVCCGCFLIGISKFFLLLINFTEYLNIGCFSLKSMSFAIASLLVILHLVLQLELPSEVVFGHADSKYFTDYREDLHYTTQEEINAIKWLTDNKILNQSIAADFYGRGYLPLVSYGKLNRYNIRNIQNASDIGRLNGELIYMQKLGIVNSVYKNRLADINSLKNELKKLALIYNSGRTNISLNF